MNPWDDPKGIGFQIIHSFLAFGSGGIFGAGLGNSKQKLFYLPEPHTDFALSIMGEELGLLGVTVTIVLFGILIMGGIRVALNQQRSLQQLSGPRIDMFFGPAGNGQHGCSFGVVAHKRAYASTHQLWRFIPGNDLGGHRGSIEYFFQELN